MLAVASAPATGGASLAAVPKILGIVGASLVGGKVSRDQARAAAHNEDAPPDFTGAGMYASDWTPKVEEIED